jgi:hypothetical protein
MDILQPLIPEDTLYPLWQDFCIKKQSSPDKRICGFFPGVLNRFDGPDFQGAEVEIDGIRYRGDVEIHLHLKDWFNHGHHLDSRYDRVILHLVWDYDDPFQQPVVNSKNLSIPTFSLRCLTLKSPEVDEMKFLNCRLPLQNRGRFWSGLQELALQRLSEKGRQIQNMLAGEGKEQTLYQLIGRLLGSPNNNDNFQRFTLLLPWPELQIIKRTVHPSIEVWLCLFLYVSGFLEHEEHLKSLANPVRRFAALYQGTRMPYSIWKTGGQRPWNHPLHRLQGLAHFVHQWNNPSLYQTFSECFSQRLPYRRLLNILYHLLTAEPSRFWYQELYRVRIDPKIFWGKVVQTELIGNVLVPFFYQEAVTDGSGGYADYLEDFFLFLPFSSRYGRLQSFYKWPDWPSLSAGRGFYLNQALLKLQEGFCYHNACADCPLGRVQEKN